MVAKNREQTDARFIQIALECAARGLAAGEVPVGAVLVRVDNIIATAHNKTMSDSDPTAHAEVLALRQGCKTQGSPRLDDATLYVTVEPCIMCAGALLQTRIKRLVFATRESRTGGVVSIADTLMNSANTHHIAVTEGVMATEAAQLMKQFFSERR